MDTKNLSVAQSKKLHTDKQIFAFSIIVNLAIWILLMFNVRPTGDLIPLHYNIYFGINLIGEWYQIFVIPAFGVFVIVINGILTKIYTHDAYIKRMLLVSSVFNQFLLLLSAILLT